MDSRPIMSSAIVQSLSKIQLVVLEKRAFEWNLEGQQRWRQQQQQQTPLDKLHQPKAERS